MSSDRQRKRLTSGAKQYISDNHSMTAEKETYCSIVEKLIKNWLLIDSLVYQVPEACFKRPTSHVPNSMQVYKLKVPLTPFCFKIFLKRRFFWAFLWKNFLIWSNTLGVMVSSNLENFGHDRVLGGNGFRYSLWRQKQNPHVVAALINTSDRPVCQQKASENAK